jgi:hypothetical protein
MDLSKLKYNDYLWLSIACIAGTLMWSLPSILHPEGKDGGIFFIIVTLAILLTGTVFGYLKPQRPWRWALASVLFLPIIELITIAAAPEEGSSSLSLVLSLPYVLIKVPIYALQGLPMLIGAYLGAYIKKRQAKEKSDSVATRQNRIWWLGFILGFLSGVPYIATPLQTSTFPVFILPIASIILFLSAMGISFYLPQKAWRCAIAVAIGLPAAVICKIIIDSAQDSSSHNMFPFEIFFSLVISIPSTFIGAFVGLKSKSIYTKLRKKNPSDGI